METGLGGKVVLVTGGAGGIGEAICRKFAEEGANVVVHFHTSSEEAESLAMEIGGVAVHADLRVPSQADEMVAEVVSKMGNIDVCVANSGSYPTEPKPMWEIDDDAQPESLLTLEVKSRPYPVDPHDTPFVIRESDDDRGHAYVIHWKEAVQFDDGRQPKKTLWFKDKSFGSREAAKEAAWSYFKDCLLYTSPSPRDVEESP